MGFGDVIVFKVCFEGGFLVFVDVWKGVIFCYDLFYMFYVDYGVIICDNVVDLFLFLFVVEW